MLHSSTSGGPPFFRVCAYLCGNTWEIFTRALKRSSQFIIPLVLADPSFSSCFILLVSLCNSVVSNPWCPILSRSSQIICVLSSFSNSELFSISLFFSYLEKNSLSIRTNVCNPGRLTRILIARTPTIVRRTVIRTFRTPIAQRPMVVHRTTIQTLRYTR